MNNIPTPSEYLNSEMLTSLKKLRAPFEAHHISKLPKPLKADSPKGRCDECGGYHGLPALHLEYVGHAALTDRLLEVDLLWSWEPLSSDPTGLPMLDKDNGMWIKLTICGMTRLGYGSADGKTGGNAIKERIGDALRNAAMRFGCALDLWHKGILHMDTDFDQDVLEPINKIRHALGPKGFNAACEAIKRGETTISDVRASYALTDDQDTILIDLKKGVA